MKVHAGFAMAGDWRNFCLTTNEPTRSGTKKNPEAQMASGTPAPRLSRATAEFFQPGQNREERAEQQLQACSQSAWKNHFFFHHLPFFGLQDRKPGGKSTLLFSPDERADSCQDHCPRLLRFGPGASPATKVYESCSAAIF
jgi:hypothetical protein